MIDPHTLSVLEFDAIRQMLADEAHSAAARDLALNLLPGSGMQEIDLWLEETAEMRKMMASAGRPPLQGLLDIRPHLRRAQVLGAMLSGCELKEVERVLSVTERLRSYFQPLSSACPLLGSYFRSLRPQPQLRDRIASSIGEEGEVLDSATPRLRRLRREAIELREKIREKLQSMTHSPAYRGVIVEPLVTIRNERYVIPVRPGFKSVLKGFIQDQSASGQTLFVEPLAVVEDNNHLKLLRLAEEEEIRKVLSELTQKVREKGEEIGTSVEAMVQLDFLLAKAALAERMGAQRPLIRENGALRLIRARHPLLIRKAEGRAGEANRKEEVVPIELVLPDSCRIMVITGPNMGGKTVALKTAGLLCLMAMSGLHIPASADSELPLFSDIFADIGEEQNIEQSLSTFSSHILQVVKVLKEADSRSLVLLDELGSGTDPQEGSALGIAILEELYQRGATVLVTTHQEAIKAHAYSHPGMTNAAVEFDLDTLRPLYKLNIGVPGRSLALEVARVLGVPASVIAKARSLMGTQVVAWDSLLERIQEELLSVAEKRRQTEQEAQQASHLRMELERQLEEIRQERRIADREVRSRLELVLSRAQREIERIVRELRAEAASSESIKKSREALVALRSELIPEPRASREAEERGEKQAHRWAKGDLVWIKGLRQEGMVTALPDSEGLLEVQVRYAKMRLSDQEVEPIGTTERGRGEQVRVIGSDLVGQEEIGAELILVGKRREEAIREAERYLDRAALAGLKEVRIVHGKGTGILRRGIEEMLRSHPLVEEFHLASFDEGGAGATIVTIKP